MIIYCIWLPYQTLEAADLRDPEISGIIATKMKEFHQLNMPGTKKIVLWDRLRYTPLANAFLFM